VTQDVRSGDGNGSHLPSYDELQARTPAGAAWGVWGDADVLGTLNLLTPERVAAAARLIVTGRVFRLDFPLDTFTHGLFGRRPPEHHVLDYGDAFDDYLDGMYLQGTSQWDALRHIRHPTHGFYNGVRAEEAGRAGRLGIDSVARSGIVGRGLLLDVDRHQRSVGDPLDCATSPGPCSTTARRPRGWTSFPATCC
jgi:hypothetical protein